MKLNRKSAKRKRTDSLTVLVSTLPFSNSRPTVRPTCFLNERVFVAQFFTMINTGIHLSANITPCLIA